MKVLIADDDKGVCQLLGTVLRSRGYTVVFAEDAAQAVTVAKNNNPEVIVLSINMPGGTGVGALEILKSSMLTSMIPVLVISSSPDEQYETKTRQIGAAGFMQKPLDLERFGVAIDELFGLTTHPMSAIG